MIQWRQVGLRSSCALLLMLLAASAATPAHAAKDVVQFGSTIKVAKDATIHDAVCFFCSVNVDGNVNGDIVVFFGSVRLTPADSFGQKDGDSAAHANHDVVAIFGDVNAGDNTGIGEDLVAIFGSVRLGDNVSVGRDAVVLFGSLRTAASSSVAGNQVVQPGWIFWIPFLLIFGGISFVVRTIRGQRRIRMLRGY